MGSKPIKALQDPSNEGKLKFNKSKTGSLNKEEFEAVLAELQKDAGACFNMTFLDDTLDNLFTLADSDGDGVIAYLEFKEFLEDALIGAKPRETQRVAESVPTVNVMIVGKPKAGKTSFVLSAMKDTEGLNSPILPSFEFKKKEVKFDGHKMILNIYDPPNRLYADKAGKVDEVMKIVEGMILVFDVTDKSAFKKPIFTHAFIDEWKEKKGNAPMILVACKCDTHHERMIFEEAIEENMESLGVTTYYETQAKTGVGIEEALEGLCREIYKARK